MTAFKTAHHDLHSALAGRAVHDAVPALDPQASAKYDLEVIVVDNGSRDESLAYLRRLPWIRLIERPEERPTNWPLNVFTAWDRGLRWRRANTSSRCTRTSS